MDKNETIEALARIVTDLSTTAKQLDDQLFELENHGLAKTDAYTELHDADRSLREARMAIRRAINLVKKGS